MRTPGQLFPCPLRLPIRPGERDKATFERLHLLFLHPFTHRYTTRKKRTNRLTARQKLHVYMSSIHTYSSLAIAGLHVYAAQTGGSGSSIDVKLSVALLFWCGLSQTPPLIIFLGKNRREKNSGGQLETFSPNRYSFVNRAEMTMVHGWRSIFTTGDDAPFVWEEPGYRNRFATELTTQSFRRKTRGRTTSTIEREREGGGDWFGGSRRRCRNQDIQE